MNHLEDMTNHAGHEGENDSSSSSVAVAKVVAMVGLFLAAMVAGIVSILLAKKLGLTEGIKNSNKVVVMLLSFGGGALLCTTFQHVLPEVAENIDSLTCKGLLPEMSFHLASLLMCLGFFTIYFVEELVHLYLHHRTTRCHDKEHMDSALVRSLSIRKSQTNNNCPPTISTTDLISKDPEKPPIATIEHSHSHSHGHGHSHSHSHTHIPVAGNVEEDPMISSLRGLLIVLALSIHELFEGLAVGLESQTSYVWYMFGSVAAHKLVLAFCVGVELVTSKTKTWLAVIYLTTFAAVSPLGIGIGLILSGGQGASASGLPSVILQGLASGTLLYVVFFEILQRERSGFVQLLSAMVGFFVMFGLQFIAQHNHEENVHCVYSHDTHDHHEH